MQADNFVLLCCALKVPVYEGRLIDALLTHQVVKPIELELQYGFGEGGVRVATHRLRDRLRPLGVKISNQYGVGYFLDADSRAKIRARVDSFSEAVAAI